MEDKVKVMKKYLPFVVGGVLAGVLANESFFLGEDTPQVIVTVPVVEEGVVSTRFDIVRSGSCYSLKWKDTGYIMEDCYTLPEAKAFQIRMDERLQEKEAHASRGWEEV